MGIVWHHVKLAVRSWRQRPTLFGIALVTLALGMGANTAVFTAVNGVLLASLPFDEPDRAVIVWGSNPVMAARFNLPDKLPAAPAIFHEWQRDAKAFAHLALFSPQRLALTGRGEPEALGGVRASAAFFDAVGVRALVGRTFTAEDDQAGAPKVAVISHALWQRRFGSDPAMVGAAITLNGEPVTIVGVAPPAMQFPRGAEMPGVYGFSAVPDLWTPFAWDAETRAQRASRSYIGVGRLRPDATIEQANAQIVTIAARAAEQQPTTDKGWSGRVEPLREQLVGDLRPSLLLLAGAAALVLLIACANVANLLLVAGAGRQREMAIRTALGAQRARLIGQLLSESAMLALAGGLLGGVLALWGVSVMRTVLPTDLAHLRDLTMDWRVLLFSGALSIGAGLVFGVTPALLVARTDLRSQLNDAGRGSSVGARGSRTRRLLVAAETALAVVLLVGAGLLLRSFWSLLQVDPGFRPEQILSVSLRLDRAKYPGDARITFYQSLGERIRALPGVQSVGLVDELPLAGGENLNFLSVEGRPRPKPGEAPMAGDRVATPGYFETMRIPLKRGRAFTVDDRRDGPRVALIDEAMAQAHWPGEDPIGRRFKLGAYDAQGPVLTVVGIVGNVRHNNLQMAPQPMMYRPFAQSLYEDANVVVRTTGDPAALTSAFRDTVRALDPNQPLAEVRTLAALVDASVAQRRFVMLLLGAFAALALTLACVGIYGVISYTVTLRTREVGVRMALGASPRQVMRQILLEGFGLAAAGIALGLIAAASLTSFVASMLYGVTRFDPITFAGVPIVLALVALLACYAPGRRAMRVDPMLALRAE